MPTVVVADNGGEFEAAFDELLRQYGVRRIHTAPYRPQANGVAERAHGFLQSSLAIMVQEHQRA